MMMTHTTQGEVEIRAWDVLNGVLDPEIPVLSIVDLGIVRWIETECGGVTVALSPTYSGCPATEVIEASVITALKNNGFDPVQVQRVLSPPWTTDWVTKAGKEKLRAYGIAPPQGDALASDALCGSTSKRSLTSVQIRIACPACGSVTTTRISEFGSTPCKASYKCDECLEPFEYFKCI